MEQRAVPVGDLSPFHRNARQGDVGRISESLRLLGQYRPIVVNIGTHTGRPMEVLAGNHTLEAAKALGWEEIEATFVDVPEDKANRIVLVDNRTNDLAAYDERALLDLLSDLPDLEGTGFDLEDLDDLAASLAGRGVENENPHDWKPGDPVVATNIVWDDEEQANDWTHFVRWLKDQHPDVDTLAGRLHLHVQTVLSTEA